MPQSKKDLKKKEQREKAASGIVYNKKEPEQYITCQICKQSIRLTKKSIEVVQHAENKHTKEGVAGCYPGWTPPKPE